MIQEYPINSVNNSSSLFILEMLAPVMNIYLLWNIDLVYSILIILDSNQFLTWKSRF